MFSALALAPARRRALAPEDHYATQGEGWLVGSRLPQVTGRLGHALAALMVSRETHGCGEMWWHKQKQHSSHICLFNSIFIFPMTFQYFLLSSLENLLGTFVLKSI